MRKKLIVIGITLVLVVAAVWGGSAIYASIENNNARDPLSLSSPTPGAGSAHTLDAADISGTWKVSAGSQAGYRVKEVLNGQNATVVGRTSDITGELTIDGTTLSAATVTVEMDHVATDNSSRDRQFQGILKTSEFPTSTFTLTSPVDIGAVVDGTFTGAGVGELTIAGVTKTVTANLQAQTMATGVEVQGSIPITFSDFGVTAPNLGFVAVENSGTVEMLLQLGK